MLTIDEVADKLGIDSRSVQKYISKGIIKATKRDGMMLVAEEDADKYLCEHPRGFKTNRAYGVMSKSIIRQWLDDIYPAYKAGDKTKFRMFAEQLQYKLGNRLALWASDNCAGLYDTLVVEGIVRPLPDMLPPMSLEVMHVSNSTINRVGRIFK